MPERDEWHAKNKQRDTGLSESPGPVIEYMESGEESLDLIQPLWEKLLAHHLNVARNFKENRKVDFSLRKQQLLDKSRNGALYLDLVKDQRSGELIGYCVASLNTEKLGEIDSIFVEKDYRGNRIGGRLMKRALGWLEKSGAKRTILGVGEGNEEVFSFYRRYGFYPRTTILERKEAGT